MGSNNALVVVCPSPAPAGGGDLGQGLGAGAGLLLPAHLRALVHRLREALLPPGRCHRGTLLKLVIIKQRCRDRIQEEDCVVRYYE